MGEGKKSNPVQWRYSRGSWLNYAMRLISDVILLLFLDPLYGVRYLIVAIPQSPARVNKEHPLNTAGKESLLYRFLVCARPSEISISTQLLGLMVLPKHRSSPCFMGLAVPMCSGLPGKSPLRAAWKSLLSSLLCNSHCCHILSWQSVYTIRVKCFVFQEADKGRDERAPHTTYFVFAHRLI